MVTAWCGLCCRTWCVNAYTQTCMGPHKLPHLLMPPGDPGTDGAGDARRLLADAGAGAGAGAGGLGGGASGRPSLSSPNPSSSPKPPFPKEDMLQAQLLALRCKGGAAMACLELGSQCMLIHFSAARMATPALVLTGPACRRNQSKVSGHYVEIVICLHAGLDLVLACTRRLCRFGAGKPPR